MKSGGSRDSRKDEFETGATDVERGLRRLVPAAFPPGLGERILDRAAEAGRGAMLRPWMCLAAAACSFLIVAILALDPVLARREESRLAAVLDGRAAAVSDEDEAAVLAETMGGEAGAKQTAWIVRLEMFAAAASRQEQERRAIEARKSLKGWWEHETLEDLE